MMETEFVGFSDVEFILFVLAILSSFTLIGFTDNVRFAQYYVLVDIL